MTVANNFPNNSDNPLQASTANQVDAKPSQPQLRLKVVPPTKNNPIAPAGTPPLSQPNPIPVQPPVEKTNSGSKTLVKIAVAGLIVAGLSYVALQPVSHSVSGEATIESTPGQRQAVTMPESGEVKKIYVRLNDKVRVGQPIVELHSDELNRQADELNSRLIQVKSEQESAQAKLIVSQSNREQLAIRLQNRRFLVQKLQREIIDNQQPRIRELESAKSEKQTAIEGLKIQRATLNEQLLRYQPLYQAGALPLDRMTELRLKLGEISTQIVQTQYQVKAIDAQIALVKKQEIDELQEKRQPEVDDADAAMNSAQKEIQKVAADVEMYSRQIPLLESQIQKLQVRRDKLTVYANKSGIVITPDLDILEGQKLAEGKDVLTIADDTKKSAVIELTQEDYKLVRRGMPVVFRPLDAEFNGYKAVVEELPPTVSFDPTQQKRTVKVRLKFEDENAVSELMLGTLGNAHIEVERMRVGEKVSREFLKLFPVGKFF